MIFLFLFFKKFKGEDDMRKSWKISFLLVMGILLFMMASLWNVSDGSYEMDIEMEANKIIVVDHIWFPKTSKVPLSFFRIGEYDTLVIHRMRSKIKYYGERLLIEGSWVEAEGWIRLGKPHFAFIKQLEIHDQKMIVYYGRSTLLVVLSVIAGAINLFSALVILSGIMLSKSQLKIKKSKEE